MTVTQTSPTRTWSTPTTRRIGYVIAIAVNAAILYVVNHLLAWGWPPWLTDEFEEVLPILSISLLASILANVLYLGYDAAWFKSLTQVVVIGIAMAATIALFGVFPFDFSAYEFNWAVVARMVLILAMVGAGIAMITESVKFVAALMRRPR